MRYCRAQQWGAQVIDDAVSDDRLSKRASVLLDARCRTSRWRVNRFELANISAGGCRLLGAAGLVPGQDVDLRIANLKPIAGTVRWQHNGDAGVEFRQPLAPAALNRLVDAYAVTPDAFARR